MSDEDSKDRSQERGKTTLKDAGLLVAIAGAEVVAPGTGLAVGVAGVAWKHLEMFLADQAQERLESFSDALLLGLSDAERLDFAEKEFDLGDFTALLRALVRDLEDEKAEMYGTTIAVLRTTTCRWSCAGSSSKPSPRLATPRLSLRGSPTYTPAKRSPHTTTAQPICESSSTLP